MPTSPALRHASDIEIQKLASSLGRALSFLNRTASSGERRRIVAAFKAHRVPLFHAISAVLGGCCHCAACLR